MTHEACNDDISLINFKNPQTKSESEKFVDLLENKSKSRRSLFC